MASPSLYCLCLALCILQAAIGEPRPDFGTSQKFQASSYVNTLATDIGVQVSLVDDELNFTLDSLGGLAKEYLPFFQELADKIVLFGSALASKLATLALSSTNKDTQFGELYTLFDDLSKVYGELSWPMSLDGLLGQQLYEALDLAFQALGALRAALQDLYNQLSPESSEEEFDNAVFPQLEQALQLLHARLTLLVYVFQRAGSNIHEASNFYESYHSHVNDIPDQLESASSNYSSELILGRLFIEGEFEPIDNAYVHENQELNAGLVGPITKVPSYPGLVSALNKIRSDGSGALATLVDTDLPNALNIHLTSVNYWIFNVFVQISDYPIEQTLADYLVRSDANAELCFHRVEAQACELPLQVPIRVQECLDRERPRLCRMLELASHIASLQIADIQDVWENLEPCTRIRHSHQRNRCVKHLSTIYDALGTAHLNKYEDFMELIQQTLASSTNRVIICLLNVDFYSLGTVVPRLEQDLNACTGCVGHTCPTMNEPE